MTAKDYIKRLRELDSEIFRNMGKVSQITIDRIQETIIDLDRDFTCDEPVYRDELGSINYQNDVLLEVFNPEKEYDIDVLKRFDKIIEEWRNNVDFVNRALGIPLHKG